MNTNLQTKNRKQSKDPKDGKAKSEDLSLMGAFPKTSAAAQTMDLATTAAVAPVVDLATAAAVAPVIASAMAPSTASATSGSLGATGTFAFPSAYGTDGQDEASAKVTDAVGSRLPAVGTEEGTFSRFAESMESVEGLGHGAVSLNGSDSADQPGKPMTVEERLARLEELFANHKSVSHSTQAYEQSRKTQQTLSQAARVQEIMGKLQSQTEEARKLYPNLNLAQEAKDPRFVELLKCGLDVKSAFEVVHKDEIISASMEYAARQVERMLTNKVLESGGRPTENGGIHGPALSKTDPKAMTRQERKDIVRRVFAGEKITF